MHSNKQMSHQGKNKYKMTSHISRYDQSYLQQRT
ncbi:unnamed protein product [Callosobruchus maculatus]|uniref:Uncharacterized protein n=1 Tax=Callosobruchus maculatus TaxID=64391 RepID=A0A653CRH1_CALMS|nr:unnamed protein product [Callosobruchus maculatus]